MASTPHFTDFSKSNNRKIKSVTQKNQSTIKTTNQSRSKNGKLSLLKPKNYYQREKPQQHQEVPELFYCSRLLMKYYMVWFFFRCCDDGE